MNCIIYICDNSDISIYTKYNECARFAKHYGYSIYSKVLDFSGTEFYKAVDKTTFTDEVSCLIVYEKKYR